MMRRSMGEEQKSRMVEKSFTLGWRVFHVYIFRFVQLAERK